ncbi:hypothetical protein NUW58_g2260 [Xylaria curta]|uniref:Uncharacterized protein n=1 Tax=Xylaria curta TaxID=42375 RepID=A0ACC1PIE5_9PEZI|nr:hypothetical protein NUW58_g2260 [Xylaria curta]
MRFITHVGSVLVAATAVKAASQCPIIWDDPRDEPGHPEYRYYNPYYNGTGKVFLRAGCSSWRQNYPRNITGEPVGCMNEYGLVVPVEGDNCATFNYIPATGELEDYPVNVLRPAKNNWICGTDYSGPGCEFCTDGHWACKELGDRWGGDGIDIFGEDAPIYLAGYLPGVISTSIFTWWIQHPPQSTADTQTLYWRVPDNPYSNHTVLPGEPTFPVLIEFVKESDL